MTHPTCRCPLSRHESICPRSELHMNANSSSIQIFINEWVTSRYAWGEYCTTLQCSATGWTNDKCNNMAEPSNYANRKQLRIIPVYVPLIWSLRKCKLFRDRNLIRYCLGKRAGIAEAVASRKAWGLHWEIRKFVGVHYLDGHNGPEVHLYTKIHSVVQIIVCQSYFNKSCQTFAKMALFIPITDNNHAIKCLFSASY